ncbi:MAG: site-2 protease family protein [Rhodoluna sp.]|nr:site-2 protease family protein [Rhodoluna sp.]
MSETLWYVGGIVFVAIGIGISIGLHELGHLWPAKKFGIKVPTYAIGFGPTLFKVTRGETTYAIKLIPLGGYITMIGMYPPSKDPEPTDVKRSFFADMIFSARNAHSEHVTAADKNRMFYQLPVWKRMIIMFGGPFMNLVLGTVLMIVVLSGFGTPQLSTKVAEVSQCVSVSVEECVPGVDASAPALAAGIKPGDTLVSINGKTISSTTDLSGNLVTGQSAQIALLRDGATLNVSVTPVEALRIKADENGNAVVDAAGEPVMEMRPVIGVLFGTERQPQSILSSLERSAWSVGQVGQMIMTLPQQLTQVAISTFTGEERNPNGAVSVVGIAQISGTIASADQATFIDKFSTGLLILASLNFALFGFNMLPLLPLDGGHIAGGIYESLKRGLYRVLRKPAPGPADTALLMPVTWFVFILLMAMSALLIIADLVNPISI